MHMPALRIIADIQATLLRPDWAVAMDDVERQLDQLTEVVHTRDSAELVTDLSKAWHDVIAQLSGSRRPVGEPPLEAFRSALDRLRLNVAGELLPGEHRHLGATGSTRHLWLAAVILALGFCGVAWLLAAIVRSQRALEHAHDSLEQRVSDRTAELAENNTRLQDEVERRRSLEKEILTIASEEQSRIAGFLHDDLGQRLTALSLNVATLKRQLPDDAQRGMANDLAAQVKSSADALRNIVRGLYPSAMSHDELRVALEALATDTTNGGGCRCVVDLEDSPDLSNLIDNVQVYGIIRESVANAVRHGRAKNVSIKLAGSGGALDLIVTDDGDGFDVHSTTGSKDGGVGLQLMHYRADILRGSIDVESIPGAGTRVHARLPLGDAS